MVQPIMIILGLIPAIAILAISIPLLTAPEIPFSASGPDDHIRIEFTRHHINNTIHGVTERIIATQSEILVVEDDGSTTYTITSGGSTSPQIHTNVDSDKVSKLTALIKETGFMSIPSDSFPIDKNSQSYQKSIIKVTLNGQTQHLSWFDENATSAFVPPIVTAVESELSAIVDNIAGNK